MERHLFGSKVSENRVQHFAKAAMSHTFCAQLSRESGEDLIGSAPNHSMYVLIECPLPWAPNAFDSKAIPLNLKIITQKIQQVNSGIRFLLFSGMHYPSSRSLEVTQNKLRVIVFRKAKPLSNGYRKREFELDSIHDVASLLEQYLAETGLAIDCHDSDTQDIFVCTHGSHDKCCAKFGYPFYRQALEIVSQLQLSKTRIWQVSHIGGHRFAPTIVTFPDGRYYGALDETSLTAILQRTGDIQCLQRVYRGWGILPEPIQVMERAIALKHGWNWFQYRVDYRILDVDSMQVEFRCERPGEPLLIYTATIVEDPTRTRYLLGSCNSTQPTQFKQFSLENLKCVSQQSPQQANWSKLVRPLYISEFDFSPPDNYFQFSFTSVTSAILCRN
jgi:hypothetical protein